MNISDPINDCINRNPHSSHSVVNARALAPPARHSAARAPSVAYLRACASRRVRCSRSRARVYVRASVTRPLQQCCQVCGFPAELGHFNTVARVVYNARGLKQPQ